MKKFSGLLVAVVLAVSIATLWPRPQMVDAAACANVSSFGSVTLAIPELSRTQEQVLWVRMQAPDNDSVLLAELNQSQCLEIGGHEQPIEQWTWQTLRSDGNIQLINFERPGGNTLKLIGINDGVKVDRILLTEADCTPRDFGNNCQKHVEVAQSIDQEVIRLEPLTDGPVSGKVLLSSTPEQQHAALKELVYTVNGRKLQTSDRAVPFDTTVLENGKYTVYITTRLQDGTVIKESTAVEIKNAENFLTPAIRWIKLHWTSIKLILLVAGVVLAVIVIFRLIIGWLRHRRERSFHGF